MDLTWEGLGQVRWITGAGSWDPERWITGAGSLVAGVLEHRHPVTTPLLSAGLPAPTGGVATADMDYRALWPSGGFRGW